jgi:hypothetical protein
MALFDDASLVTTPNGYKAGTLYSIKPTSGAGDMDVVRATTATRVNSAGLIESVAINVPRLDYTDSTCPRLLLEPQRTNLITYSEQFDNAYWQKLNGGIGLIPTVTANTATAPDGTLTADRIQLSLNGGTSGSVISYINTSASTTAATFSIYAKSNTTPCTIYFRSGSTVTTINITTEWQRFELYSSGAITVAQFGLRGGSYGGAVNSNTADISVWGGQLEVGNYPTSYISTSGSTVTRNADVISKTGISSLINSTEGVLFAEINTNTDSTDKVFSINNGISGSGNSRLWMGYSTASKNVYALGYVNNTLQFLFSKTMTDESIFVKIACKYAVNDAAFYVNGVQEGTDTSALAFSGLNSFNFNIGTGAGAGGNFYGNVKQIVIFPTALTDAQCIELTTL